jgi:hypothetical protein
MNAVGSRQRTVTSINKIVRFCEAKNFRVKEMETDMKGEYHPRCH